MLASKMRTEIDLLGKDKANACDMKDLSERLEAFCQLEHMDYLQNILLPKL